MSKGKYKISVITVVYNGAKTIERAIKSVLEQSYENIEYIIIDGLSSDGTQQIVMQYKDSIAYFISEKDAGIYDAMNKGIGYATGDYIIFINSDDSLLKDSLEQCVEYLSNDIDILYGDVYFVREDNVKNRIKGELKDMEDIIYHGICHQAVLAKTELLKSNHFDLNYKIAADYDWLLKNFCRGANFVYAPIVFSYYGTSGYSALNRELCSKEYYKISAKYLKKSCKQIQEKYDSIIKRLYSMYLLEDIFEDSNGNETIKMVLGEAFAPGEEIYMFGRGYNADICLKILSILGINILKIFDNNKEIQGTIYQGIEVVGLDQSADKNRKVIVSTTNYEGEAYHQLIESGFSNIVLFSDIKEEICRVVSVCSM